MIFISKSGHAKSMNIDIKIYNLSYLSPNHHNIVTIAQKKTEQNVF